MLCPTLTVLRLRKYRQSLRRWAVSAKCVDFCSLENCDIVKLYYEVMSDIRTMTYISYFQGGSDNGEF